MAVINLGGVFGERAVTMGAASATNFVNLEHIQYDAGAFVSADHQAVEVQAPTFTVEGDLNGLRFGAGYSPTEFMSWGTCLSVDDKRVQVGANTLSNFNSFSVELYKDFQLEVRRIEDGEMRSLGLLNVEGAEFASLSLVTPKNTVVQDTWYAHVFSQWNKNDTNYWFAVAAVTADGRIGALSDWSSFALTGEISGVAENHTVSLEHSDDVGALVAPKNVIVRVSDAGAGVADVAWSDVEGAAGYVVYIGYSDPQTWPESGEHLIVEADHGIAAGDLLIWRKPILKPIEDYICSRVTGSWTTVKKLLPYNQPIGNNQLNQLPGDYIWEFKRFESGDKPSETIGEYYVEHRVSSGSNMDMSIYWQGGSGQTFYYVKNEGDVFCSDCWVWASEATSLEFSSGCAGEPVQDIPIAAGWQFVQARSEYWVEDLSNTPRKSKWNFTAGDGDLVLRHAGRCSYIEGEAFGQLTTDLANSTVPGQYWRDHTLVKTNHNSYAMSTILSPNGEGYRGWTIPQHFAECQRLELNPWTQVEFSMREDEMLAYLDMVADVVDDFDGVKLEMSNETWNSLESFLTIPSMLDQVTGEEVAAAEVYGMMQHMVYGWLQASPHWGRIEPKLSMVIGGRNGHDYGERAWAHAPDSKEVDVAQYNGGWDVTSKIVAQDGASFTGMQQFGYSTLNLETREDALKEAAQAKGKVVGVDVFHNIYEGGPGYQVNGLNGAQVSDAQMIDQEVVRKSRASAMAMVTSYCTQSLRGWRYNFFTLERGDLWKSHREDGCEYLTYTVAMEPYRRLGAFRAFDVSDFKSSETNDIRDADVYAMQSVADPTHWLLAVVNRKLDAASMPIDDPLYDAQDDGMRAVSVFTPFKTASSCAIMAAGIGNAREHNRYPEGTRLNVDGGYDDDPLCVEFDTSWRPTPVPDSLNRFAIDDRLGADANGLRGGNFLFMELKGVELL